MIDPDLEGGLPAVEPAAEASNGLDSIINSALDAQESDAASTGQDAAENTSGRQRDERGRFVGKAGESSEGESLAEPEAVQTEAQPAETQPLEAPARWTAEDKAKFAAWPRDVQEAVIERHKAMEADYTRKSQDIAEFRRHAEPLLEAVQPFNDYLGQIGRLTGAHPAQLVGQLIQTEYALRTGTPEQKQQALAKIAAEYGISLANTAGDGSQPDPFVNHLYQRQPQIDSRLSHIEQFVAQEEQRRISQTIESFAAEKDATGQPKHPFFEDVKPHMAALMQAGQASTLQEAYEMAVSPFKRLMDQQQASRQQAEERTRQEALEKARRAAPMRASGTAPRGSTQAKGLDALLTASLDRAGLS